MSNNLLKIASTDVDDWPEATEALVRRFAVTPTQLAEMGQYAHDRAFTYAGAAQLSVVKQVHDELIKYTETGEPFSDFKKRVKAIIVKDWGDYKPAEGVGKRIELIAHNAVQKSYSAGRWQQLNEPTTMKVRPFWIVDIVLDGRTSKLCLLIGKPPTILPAGDPWFLWHWPPLHHKCRTTIRALRRSVAEKKGVTENPNRQRLEGDWGGAPGVERPWVPAPADVPQPARLAWDEKQRIRPPRPALPPTPSVQIKAFKSVLNEVDTNYVLSQIGQAGLTPALSARPIQAVSLLDVVKIKSERGVFNGTYLMGDIKVAAKGRVFGKPFVPGEAWSMSTVAKTNLASMRSTLLHELGHHFRTSFESVRKLVTDRFVGIGITEMAQMSASEWFSESLAAYYSNREELRAFDPNAYSTIEDALKLMGVPLGE